eukprot:2836346-Rhodomonas_salina.3
MGYPVLTQCTGRHDAQDTPLPPLRSYYSGAVSCYPPQSATHQQPQYKESCTAGLAVHRVLYCRCRVYALAVHCPVLTALSRYRGATPCAVLT